MVASFADWGLAKLASLGGNVNQDEVYELVTNLVRNLTCAELKQWLRTCKSHSDPRKLPKYAQYQSLFTEKGRGNWPAMHMVSLMAFDQLAEVKMWAECGGVGGFQ